MANTNMTIASEQTGSLVRLLEQPAFKHLQAAVAHAGPLRSMIDIWDNPCPKIALYDSHIGSGYIAIQLKKLIPMLYNVTNSITNEQAILAADMIIQAYPELKLNEIELALKHSCTGHNYNRIDVNVVMSWFKDYSEASGAIIEEIRHQKHLQRKNGQEIIDSQRNEDRGLSETNRMPDEVKKKFEQLDMLKAEREQKYREARTKAFEANQRAWEENKRKTVEAMERMAKEQAEQENIS